MQDRRELSINECLTLNIKDFISIATGRDSDRTIPQEFFSNPEYFLASLKRNFKLLNEVVVEPALNPYVPAELFILYVSKFKKGRIPERDPLADWFGETFVSPFEFFLVENPAVIWKNDFFDFLLSHFYNADKLSDYLEGHPNVLLTCVQTCPPNEESRSNLIRMFHSLSSSCTVKFLAGPDCVTILSRKDIFSIATCDNMTASALAMREDFYDLINDLVPTNHPPSALDYEHSYGLLVTLGEKSPFAARKILSYPSVLEHLRANDITLLLKSDLLEENPFCGLIILAALAEQSAFFNNFSEALLNVALEKMKTYDSLIPPKAIECLAKRVHEGSGEEKPLVLEELPSMGFPGLKGFDFYAQLMQAVQKSFSKSLKRKEYDFLSYLSTRAIGRLLVDASNQQFFIRRSSSIECVVDELCKREDEEFSLLEVPALKQMAKYYIAAVERTTPADYADQLLKIGERVFNHETQPGAAACCFSACCFKEAALCGNEDSLKLYQNATWRRVTELATGNTFTMAREHINDHDYPPEQYRVESLPLADIIKNPLDYIIPQLNQRLAVCIQKKRSEDDIDFIKECYKRWGIENVFNLEMERYKQEDKKYEELLFRELSDYVETSAGEIACIRKRYFSRYGIWDEKIFIEHLAKIGRELISHLSKLSELDENSFPLVCQQFGRFHFFSSEYNSPQLSFAYNRELNNIVDDWSEKLSGFLEQDKLIVLLRSENPLPRLRNLQECLSWSRLSRYTAECWRKKLRTLIAQICFEPTICDDVTKEMSPLALDMQEDTLKSILEIFTNATLFDLVNKPQSKQFKRLFLNELKKRKALNELRHIFENTPASDLDFMQDLREIGDMILHFTDRPWAATFYFKKIIFQGDLNAMQSFGIAKWAKVKDHNTDQEFFIRRRDARKYANNEACTVSILTAEESYRETEKFLLEKLNRQFTLIMEGRKSEVLLRSLKEKYEILSKGSIYQEKVTDRLNELAERLNHLINGRGEESLADIQFAYRKLGRSDLFHQLRNDFINQLQLKRQAELEKAKQRVADLPLVDLEEAILPQAISPLSNPSKVESEEHMNDSNPVTLLLQRLSSLSQQPISLDAKKVQARKLVDESVHLLNDVFDMIQLLKEFNDQKYTTLQFLREERGDFMRFFGKYGNTATWSHCVIDVLQARINEKLHSTSDAVPLLSDEQQNQVTTLFAKRNGRFW